MKDEDYKRIFPDAQEVAPGVYSANVNGYGETYVGAYDKVRQYLSAQGITGQSVHHIVQQADSHYYPKGMTVGNAPSIAINSDFHPELHNRLESKSGMPGYSPIYESRSETIGDAGLKYMTGYRENLDMPQLHRVAQTIIKTYHAERPDNPPSTPSPSGFSSILNQVPSADQASRENRIATSGGQQGE